MPIMMWAIRTDSAQPSRRGMASARRLFVLSSWRGSREGGMVGEPRHRRDKRAALARHM